jgi:hypothetical protein
MQGEHPACIEAIEDGRYWHAIPRSSHDPQRAPDLPAGPHPHEHYPILDSYHFATREEAIGAIIAAVQAPATIRGQNSNDVVVAKPSAEAIAEATAKVRVTA